LALCFLAGYPPAWVVFIVIAGIYALAGSWRWRAALGVAVSVAFCLTLVAVQALPTWEATAFREPETRYAGAREPVLLVAFLLPNYINFAMGAPAPSNPFAEYYYLGVPALLSVPLLICRRNFRQVIPVALTCLACVIVVTDPFDLLASVISRSRLFEDICRGLYFLAGLPLVFAALTGFALDDFLRRQIRPAPMWLACVIPVPLTAWAIADVVRWIGPGFPTGWHSLFDLLAPLSLFSAGLHAVRRQSGPARIWTAAALVVFVGVDYKVFGTSKRFDAAPGLGQQYSSASYSAMDVEAYQQLRAHSSERILLDLTGPLPSRLRHVGLLTPQGYDPFISIPFRELMKTLAHFSTERDFEVDLENDAALRLLGVRYIISAERGPWYPQLVTNRKFRVIGSNDFFYKVFEYLQARPPYGWESKEVSAEASLREWTPEQRTFTVHSLQGGRFTLSDQLYPGWIVSVDGRRASLERWSGAFQAVDVPAGEHTVAFRFRQKWLGIGSYVSLLALFGLVSWARSDRLNKHRSNSSDHK